MEINEINLHLCYYDKRNPNHVTFDDDGDIWKEKADQGGCNCTNCFDSKSKLANAFLDLIEKTTQKEKSYSESISVVTHKNSDVKLSISDEKTLICHKCNQPMIYAISKHLRIPFCLCEDVINVKHGKTENTNNLQKHVPIIGKPKDTDIK